MDIGFFRLRFCCLSGLFLWSLIFSADSFSSEINVTNFNQNTPAVSSLSTGLGSNGSRSHIGLVSSDGLRKLRFPVSSVANLIRRHPAIAIATALASVGVQYADGVFFETDTTYEPSYFWYSSGQTGRQFSSVAEIAEWHMANHSQYAGSEDYIWVYSNTAETQARITYRWYANGEVNYSLNQTVYKGACPTDGCIAETYKPPEVKILTDTEVGKVLATELSTGTNTFANTPSTVSDTSTLGIWYSSLSGFKGSPATGSYYSPSASGGAGGFVKNPSNGSTTNPEPTTTDDFLNNPIGVDNNPITGGNTGGGSTVDYTALLNSLGTSINNLNAVINNGLNGLQNTNANGFQSVVDAVNSHDTNRSTENQAVLDALAPIEPAINNLVPAINAIPPKIDELQVPLSEIKTAVDNSSTASSADADRVIEAINGISVTGTPDPGANPDPVGLMPSHTTHEYNSVSAIHMAFMDRMTDVPIFHTFESYGDKLEGDGTCPTFTLSLPEPIAGDVQTNVHCQVGETVAPVLDLILLVAYSFLGIRIILTA